MSALRDFDHQLSLPVSPLSGANAYAVLVATTTARQANSRTARMVVQAMLAQHRAGADVDAGPDPRAESRADCRAHQPYRLALFRGGCDRPPYNYRMAQLARASAMARGARAATARFADIDLSHMAPGDETVNAAFTLAFQPLLEEAPLQDFTASAGSEPDHDPSAQTIIDDRGQE